MPAPKVHTDRGPPAVCLIAFDFNRPKRNGGDRFLQAIDLTFDHTKEITRCEVAYCIVGSGRGIRLDNIEVVGPAYADLIKVRGFHHAEKDTVQSLRHLHKKQ